ncbi:glycosyltransferase family 25 protein [Aeromonas veronii]|uniref:glycosyltransferase family 25 protein n=1 Tax=Aeromonas veronii TaxID=654 RepID=UPI00227D176D|nr:glycosyltransferase family 25 protein [Aeromonas veronii]
MIPIFVISLLRSHERREAIEKQMARLGLSFTFFDAVDGKLLNDNDLSKVDLKLAKVFCGHSLSLGEVGCALSHIRLYEMMVKNNIDKAIILEDDIHLHMHFKNVVEGAIKKSSSDIIFIHHGKAKQWPWARKLPEGYRLSRYLRPSKKSNRGIISTAGYILNLAGARKLLKCAYPVRMPSDYLTGRLQLNALNASGIEPCCLDVGYFDTTIDDRNYGQHIK